MRWFIKRNVCNPITTFQKGDIVVLECEGKDIKTIMSINRVEKMRHGDLFTNLYLCIDEQGAFFYCMDDEDWINWHIGWVLRDATMIEKMALSYAMGLHSEKGIFKIHNVCP